MSNEVVFRQNFLIHASDFVGSQKSPIFVIPTKLVLDLIGERESREINPVAAGLTALETVALDTIQHRRGVVGS